MAEHELLDEPGALFERFRATFLCPECGAYPVRTSRHYACCPHGHGRLRPFFRKREMRLAWLNALPWARRTPKTQRWQIASMPGSDFRRGKQILRMDYLPSSGRVLAVCRPTKRQRRAKRSLAVHEFVQMEPTAEGTEEVGRG